MNTATQALNSDIPPSKPNPLPAMHAIKKRKPRSSAVVAAANQRARKAAQLNLVPIVPPPILPPLPDPPAPNAPPLAGKTAAQTAIRNTEPNARTDVKRKGLRHFAVRVCHKVEDKSITTYNEVADELVMEEKEIKQAELAAGGKAAIVLEKKLEKRGTLVDEKNIRRRVYDSLNVLMAMGIIQKDKKLISWQGLTVARSSNGSGEIDTVTMALEEKKRAIDHKRAIWNDLRDQLERTRALSKRNSDIAQQKLGEVEHLLNSSEQGEQVHHLYPDRLGIPFIIVSAPKDTSIELEMDQGREEISFTFNSAFAIYDDSEILRRMSLPSMASSEASDAMLEADRLGNQLMKTTPPLTP